MLSLAAAGDVSRHARAAPHAECAVSSTQGKLERYHRSLKNIVQLEHYYTPWEVERAVARFVEDYKHRRYHEALQNVTPAAVFFGHQATILARRQRIKQRTLQPRTPENLHTPPHAAIRLEAPLRNGARLSTLV